MKGHLTSLIIATIIGWFGFALSGLILPLPLAIMIGAALGVLCVISLRQNPAIKGLIALMGPMGVVLPLLALRHVLGRLGFEIHAFSNADLILFLLIYTALLAASLGYLPVDIYRLGYAPLPVGIMALVLCIYGALTGSIFISLVAVLGQGLWFKGWGSSNWFDHVLHAVLLPIAIITLTVHIV